MVDNYDWYRYNEGAGWEVRSTFLRVIPHNFHVLDTLSLASLPSGPESTVTG